MVARNGYGIEVADVVFDEIGLDVAHHLEGEVDGENTGVLALVLLENIGLNRAAYIGQDLGANFVIGFG